MSGQPCILLLDDDHRILTLLRRFLEREGCQIVSAASIKEAYGYFARQPLSAALLDVMLPDGSGVDLVTQIRQGHVSVARDLPIIMLSACGEIEDRLQGLKAGADDYLAKPFEPEELLLKLSSLLRRHQKHDDFADKPNLDAVTSEQNSFGDWHYHPMQQSLQHQNTYEWVRLNPCENALLGFLLQRPNLPFSRYYLSEVLPACRGEPRSIDVYIARLRQKIEINPKNPRYLLTIRSMGYLLSP